MSDRWLPWPVIKRRKCQRCGGKGSYRSARGVIIACPFIDDPLVWHKQRVRSE